MKSLEKLELLEESLEMLLVETLGMPLSAIDRQGHSQVVSGCFRVLVRSFGYSALVWQIVTHAAFFLTRATTLCFVLCFNFRETVSDKRRRWMVISGAEGLTRINAWVTRLDYIAHRIRVNA